MRSRWFFRGTLLWLAIMAATCFPMLLGSVLWPQGLSAGTELLFWPETGVAVAGLLVLGWRCWPAILAGVLVPAILLTRDPVTSLVNSCGNTAEALAAWALLRKLGDFNGGFSRSKTVGALLLAAVLAPLFSAVPGVAGMVASGRLPAAEATSALTVWWLANGSAMLLLTPFLAAVCRGDWSLGARRVEAALWLAGGLALGAWAFDAIFQFRGTNLAFLVFPFVIYAAVRFGPSETALSLAVVTGSIYFSMARHAGQIDPARATETMWFLQAFCFVLAATGLAVAALVRERRDAEALAHEQSRRALEISLRAGQTRLETLRYQINPHFLFNMLNSLRATLPHSAEASRDMVTGIAGYFRSVLSDPGRDTAPLRDEIESLRRYLAIEKIRFEENLRVTLSIDPAAEREIAPVFLLQPLVENAIRHGFASSPPPYELAIHASRHGSRLVLEVANTGTWREPANPACRGIGLENIRERLRLLHGENAALSIEARAGWVRARITLPSQ